MTWAELLKDARDRREDSQETAAETVGAHRMTWRNWERGASDPNKEWWRALASYCGVSIGRILLMLGVLEQKEADALDKATGTASSASIDGDKLP